jgi:group I intron endonuclease
VTSTGLEKRKKHHFQTAKQGGYGLFTRAIRKYGKEAFEFLIFGICRDYERALFAEQELIACICPEYNLTAGGEGMTGYKPSQETLRRLSASHIGKPGPWAGKKRSIDSIEKMVSTRRERGNYIGHSRGEKRPPEVCENVRIGRKNGKTPRPLSPEMIERRSIRFKAMNAKQGRQVRCIDDGLVFPSIKSAAQHYGIAISPVGRVVHGQAKMAKGRRFEFV